jgi:ribosomal-protein-serine acetyltransferase
MATSLNPRARHTPRFVLRPFRRRDVSAIHDAVTVSLPDLKKWLPWANERYSRSVTSHFVRDSMASWNEGRAFDFAIRRINDPNRHLGNVSVWFTSRPNRIGEIGYWIRSDETGQGICTEAVVQVLQIAFENLAMHRVTLRIAVGNIASERVAAKLGFTLEGILRHEVKVGDEWMDHTIWGLLVEEWQVERDRYRDEAWV